MMKKLVLAASAACLMASGAFAATLSGTYWDAPANSFADINTAINFANNNIAQATFDSTGIDYGDVGTNWAIGSLADFLNADAGSVVGTDDGNIQESVIKLTGSVFLNDGDIIDVTSDDGFKLIVGGNTLSEFLGLRGPNNTTSAVWAGGSGLFSTTLWYFEGNVTQAQLKSNLGDYVPAVPVPAAGFLLMGAIGGLAAMRRRKKA